MTQLPEAGPRTEVERSYNRSEEGREGFTGGGINLVKVSLMMSPKVTPVSNQMPNVCHILSVSLRAKASCCVRMKYKTVLRNAFNPA